MEEDLLMGSQREELDFLLNFSRISEENKETSFNDFSISRDKLNLTEKERTREESYEDIMKQIHQTKLERIELNKQLSTLKNEIYCSYLHPFQQEFKQLNEENMKLRKELDKPAKKYNEDKSERYSNKSSIKMRTSVKSNYGDQNKKTNAKPRKNHVSPHSLLKKDAKLAQSTANLGRSQIQSPRHHRKRQSQLTERKKEENNSMGISVNISVLEDKYQCFKIKQSVSNDQLRLSSDYEKNVFIQILENILHDQKQYQEQKYGEIQDYSFRAPETVTQSQIVFINELEREIKSSNQKLEMLTLIISSFQKEMAEMNINIKNTQEWTSKLWEVKGRYMQMERKCLERTSLRKEVDLKEQRLTQLKESHIISQEEKSISSIETMIKVFSNTNRTFNEPNKLYMRYYDEIKELFRFDKEEQTRRYNKIVKVKQTIDGIREGRKKFNELINIYESRIIKMQEKITKLKCNNQKR